MHRFGCASISQFISLSMIYSRSLCISGSYLCCCLVLIKKIHFFVYCTYFACLVFCMSLLNVHQIDLFVCLFFYFSNIIIVIIIIIILISFCFIISFTLLQYNINTILQFLFLFIKFNFLLLLLLSVLFTL